MEGNKIEAVENNILRFAITDHGKETGEYLEFDLEDIELPFRLDESYKLHNANIEDVKRRLQVLDKKQDSKGKGFMTKNQEEQVRIIQEFYKKEEKALDLFLGEGATKKMLNGRKPYLTMFEDISERIAPILPQLKLEYSNIVDKIKSKYSQKEDNVLE